jgi:superfamily I DNA/RNA helicase
MDPVEIARRTAADLHDVAVSKGLDPSDPYAFAKGVAAERGLDVEHADPGSASLNNGRATFLPEDDLIIHEDRGSAFDRAFLVAHEIGHAVLGDRTVATANEVEPTRAAEPSPVGIDRVIDYSRRQRREVQMDLFARELLLPRPLMRRMHLADGLTASQIADHMKAPFDVVAQQLVDALLLPVIELQENVRREADLNAEQETAAKHRGKAYLLEAGPGTGKTQTLTERVVHLIDEGVDPRRILVLTYSNKAAGEMSDRVAAKRPDKAAAMWMGTFHAFGLDLIRRFNTELGVSDNPRMMDRVEAVELLEAEFPKLSLEHYVDLYDPTRMIGDILAAISRAKDEVVGPERYGELARGMLAANTAAGQKDPTAEKAMEVARIYELYETLKKDRDAVDFGDLVALPVGLLEARPEIAAQLQGLYDHILVDEYQDVNRASVRLLKALCPGGRNLWVVGDARQSIYRFRGSSPKSTSRFGTTDFPGGGSSRLRVNYRSTEEIVTAYSSFAGEMTASATDASLHAHRGASGEPIELHLLDTKDTLSAAIADAITERNEAGVQFRDQAVLCTGNERLGEIARDLERMGIPVLFLGNLFERPEVKDLLSFLSLLVDRRAMGLLRAGCTPEFPMALEDVGALFEELRDGNPAPMSWLQTRAIATMSPTSRESLKRLKDDALKGFDAESSPWHVLATILLDRTKIAARIASASSVAERARGIAIWQLLNFLRVQPTGKGQAVPRLLDRIRVLMAIGDDRDLRQLPAAAQALDAVRLMTIHGSKGLEFDCVHLPGLSRDTLPGNTKIPQCIPPDGMIGDIAGTIEEALRQGDVEERECLFYVAASRARDRLFLYAVTQRADGASRPASPFLSRLGSGIVTSRPSPKLSLPLAPEMIPVPLTVTGQMRWKDSQVAMLDKDKCRRRFLYTHVLGIGGRRTESDFMKMHEATRTVIRAVVHDRLNIDRDEDLDFAVRSACNEQGLDQAGSHRALSAIAVRLVTAFRQGRVDHRHEVPDGLVLALGGDEVTFRPDDVVITAAGRRVYRRVQTGVFRKSDMTSLGAALAVLAIADKAPGSEAQLIHLTGDTTSTLSFTAQVQRNRRASLVEAMSDIRAGAFPSAPSQRICPRCPAFFVCGSIPSGTLTKNFGASIPV